MVAECLDFLNRAFKLKLSVGIGGGRGGGEGLKGCSVSAPRAMYSPATSRSIADTFCGMSYLQGQRHADERRRSRPLIGLLGGASYDSAAALSLHLAS